MFMSIRTGDFQAPLKLAFLDVCFDMLHTNTARQNVSTALVTKKDEFTSVAILGTFRNFTLDSVC